MINFKEKKVVVLGLGVSGLASARLLKRLGASVFVSDKSDNAQQGEFAGELKKLSIKYELGKHSKEIIESADYLIVSPGVSLSSEPAAWAKEKNIEILGELELGYQFCPAPIIAVTGTNGKTTVTTLIGRVLKESGKNVFVLGNIGDPFCLYVDKMKSEDIVVLEVSSFQLEAIKDFRPKLSVILNFTPNHLDRYKNLDEYLQAKKRIFLNQTKDDFVVLNYGDYSLRNLAKEVKANVSYFCNGSANFITDKLNPNQLAVIKVAEILGVDLNICRKVFKEFKGIEHRMELAANIGGVDFINDSKATNVESTMWALENSNKPVILIAGGRDKGSDFTTIIPFLKDKVKSVVLFGEAKQKIRDSLSGAVEIIEAKDMNEAVNIAFKQSISGDCVLLSPMCASFDMFLNYKERGKIFKKIVNGLIRMQKLN